ncbi:MAG: hypothetical protein ABII12_17165 [Planctomycetota bacterium]
MAQRAYFSSLRRRFGFIGLVVLSVVMVTTAGVVMMSEDPPLTGEDAFGDGVIIDPLKRPDIDFPETVRTFNLSLNRFVDRFARVCMEGKYSDLRLMLSKRGGDPLVARRFETMFNALKQVRILSLEELPEVPDLESPAYLMSAEYVLEPYATGKGRDTEVIRLAIAMEDGEWRIGPVPRELLALLDAYKERLGEGSAGGDTTPEQTSGDQPSTSTKPDTHTTRPAANRPARIGS